MDTIELMVDKVVKAITDGTRLGDTVLRPEKFDQLFREVEATSPMLAAARRIDMLSDKRDIDRVGMRNTLFGDQVADGSTTGEGHEVAPIFTPRQLSVVELVGVVPITDQALEDNIEREGLENTILSLIATRAAYDLEYMFLQAVYALHHAGTAPLLDRIDGWLEITENDGGHSVTGSGNTDFTQEDPESMFQAMKKELIDNNPEFLDRHLADYTYWVSWRIEDDYRSELRERGTDLGDRAVTENIPLAFGGIPVRPVINMPSAKALLVLNDNLVWGVRRDVRIEPERRPRLRRTDFVVSCRVDADMVDPRGAVVALLYHS